MSRGFFASIIDNEAYKNSEKNWSIELSNSWMYWYDLLANPNDTGYPFDTKKLIVEYLTNLKKKVEQSLEKRFVYFICSRPKIRFNTKKKPTYNPFTKRYKFHLLVGKKGRKKTARIAFFNIKTEKFEKNKFEITEKYITITDSEGDKTTSSIHDFLSNAEVNFELPTKVEYVGYTKNPDSRPTNGAHSGLSDVLHNVSNEESDILIFFNLFKVSTYASSQNQALNFLISNPMTNEINVDLEGQIIEKSFILYFDSDKQNKNKDNEKNELKNNLLKLSKENKIDSIRVYYEFERPTEYWLLSSSSIAPRADHRFTVKLTDDNLEIIKRVNL